VAADASVWLAMAVVSLLYEISADGTRCRAYEVAAQEMSQMYATPDGDLYFLGDGFGRLERPR
jgi:hypothetical protein